MFAWRALVVAMLCVLTLAAPAAAQVPDPFARELARKLAHAERERGYVHGAGPFSGSLGAAEARRIRLTLRAGEDYRVVGVCDARCGVPDVALYGADGVRLAAAEQGGSAILYARVPYTGGYELEIRAGRCAAAACWYAVNVYSRG